MVCCVVLCCVAQAKAFLEREAQHSADDAAIKAALCYDFHSSSDEEQLTQMSRPVSSSTRYGNLFILVQNYMHVGICHRQLSSSS
jgi:hypothetical protein